MNSSHAAKQEAIGLLDRLSEACDRHGDRIAIETRDRALTYGELDSRANQVAHCLIHNRIAPGSVVALLLEDRVELIAAMIGIFRAGCVFAPLDSDSPIEKLRHVVQALTPSLLLVGPQHQAIAAQVFGSNCPFVCIGASGPCPDLGEFLRPADTGLDEAATDSPGLAVDPDAPSYIYFTSGSTGQPKGITGRLRSLAHFVAWEIETFQLAPGCRVSQLTTPTFDAFFRDVLVPLCAGGTVCLLPDKTANLDANDLVDWIDERGIQLIHCVPSLLAAILGGNVHADRFQALEAILLSGEVLHTANVKSWRQIYGDRIRLVNLYGASEATMVQLFHVAGDADVERGFVPIGVPIDGIEVLVVDEQGNPCAAGETGEIYIKSPFLTLGYHRNPELTSQVFVPNPVTGDPEETAYRTGDLGEFLEDGSLRYHGRRDRQVKLRGIRIELGAIESCLSKHDQVRACAVIVRDGAQTNLIAKEGLQQTTTDASDLKRLIAYVVLDGPVNDSGLRAHLERQLSSYMIPAQFVHLEELPRNANGKLDLNALPEPGNLRPDLEQEFVAPRSDLEIAMASIWQDVLGLERVGVHDSFFDLGGDSLMAIQTLNRLRTAANARVKVRDLFELRTIAALAARVEESHQPNTADGKRQPLRPANKRASYPLSLAQQGLWFLWKMEPDNPYYTSQGTIHLRGELDLDVLRRAWQALLDRHQMLRVHFGVENGAPVQIFEDDPGFEMPLEDLSGLSQAERDQRLADTARQESERSFDLEHGALIRNQLFKLSDHEHVLTTAVHEITVDLWSVRELMQDLSALYDGFLTGQEAPLPPLKVQFGDYVQWEEQDLTRESLAEEEAYWKEQLHGELPVLSLPLDRPRPKLPTYQGALQNVLLDAELSNRLRALGREQDATLFMTILSAFKVMLHRYTGQDDLIVGAPLSNRTDEDRERLVGFFLNMLPLRSDLSDNPSFRELLGRVRQTVTGAISNADYPFIWMLEWAKAMRDTGSAPVFQVMFNMLSFTDVQLKKHDLEIAYRGHETGYTKYDMSFYAQEVGDQIFLQITYLRDLFDESTAERMMKNLVTLLEKVAENPDLAVADVDILHPEERHALLNEFNRTDRDFENELCIRELFEQQVEKTPDATAYFFEGEALSYAELNARANRLAHYLRDLGVGPESPVGLCVERSFEMMVAILGILKAGGAYVPLDSDYPLLRLYGILEDSRPALLLTQKELATFEDYAGEKRYLEDVWKEIDEFAGTSPENTGAPDDLVTIVYTSSTTGKPKGVQITGSSVLNRLFWMWEEYPFAASDVAVLQKSFALVAATWEMFGPLLKGVPTLIATREDQLDPVRFRQAVVTHEVTHLLATPSLLEGVLTQSEAGAEPWESLRFATTSAEPIPPAMVERWQRTFPNVPLLNLYGSTECSSNATVYDASQMPAGLDRVPIGMPLSNVRVHVVDKNQKLAPIGVTGEMCVSGACVSRGYLNRDDLNAEKFLPDPFREDSGDTLFRTGDLARYGSDGSLELLGRMDNQIKIRGFRVDPGDVESTLLRHDAVDQSAVVLTDEDGARKRLVAYVVSPSSDLPVSELKGFLRERLPEYMVPAEFIGIDALPLTANGKLDRKALPSPEGVLQQTGHAFVAPRNEMERILAEIWSDVLGVEQIGVHDNFFDLGGHSLMAVQVFIQIEERLDRALPLATLFASPTVEQLALRFETSLESGFTDSVVVLQADGEQTPLFLLPGVGGHAFTFRELAQLIGRGRPCYGLQYQGLDYQHEPLNRVDEMAAAFIEKMLAIQPHGPYMIGGYSLGGQVAQEIAHQLAEQGREVALLILLDSRLEGSKKKQPLMRRLGLHGRKLLSMGTKGRSRYLAQRVSQLALRLGAAEPSRTTKPVSPPSSTLEQRIELVSRASREAERHHTPRPFPGRAVLLRTTPDIEFIEWEDPQKVWGRCVSTLDVVDLPGHHQNLFEQPSVGILAERLSDYLQVLESRGN